MAIKKITSSNINNYNSDGSNKILLIEESDFIILEIGVISLVMEKTGIYIRKSGAWLTIGNSKESLQFLLTEIVDAAGTQKFTTEEELITTIKSPTQ